MRYANIVAIAFILIEVSCDEDIASIVDLKSLNVLPLDALLNIKKNLLSFSANDTDKADAAARIAPKESKPEALPLHGIKNINEKMGYYVQYVDQDIDKYEDKKSISKFFQLSVTKLAFLAFGGYLLFLIITSIKAKNYNYMYDANAANIMSAMLNTKTHIKRKKTKRPIRGDGIFGYKTETSDKSKTKREIKDSRMNVDDNYQSLVYLCEGYSKIEGVDQL